MAINSEKYQITIGKQRKQSNTEQYTAETEQ